MEEWSGLASELVDAAEQGSAAREDKRVANIAADLQVVKSNKTGLTNKDANDVNL